MIWVIACVVFAWVLRAIHEKTSRPWSPRDWRISLKQVQVVVALCAYALAIATAGAGQEGILISVGIIAALVLWLRGWIRDLRRLVNLPDEAFQGRPGRRYWMIMLIAFAPIGLGMFRSSFPPHRFRSVDSDP